MIDKDLVGRETATGTIPSALRPIFRDRDDFAAGKSLTEQTLAALDASHGLIVICSPDAAKSRYVDEEARLFQSRHPERPLVPLIVWGEPGDPERECFPPALRFQLDAKGQITSEPKELLAADARDEGDGKDLALAKVIAGLLGLSSDDVFRRAERERRAAARRRRRVQALVGALALLLLLGGIGWLHQDWLRERYYWHAVMRPDRLTPAEEEALKPGNQFADCRNGCPAMVVIPAGKTMLGAPQGDVKDNEQPQYEGVLHAPLAVGKYEVTFAEWDACVAAGGCRQVPDNGWGRDTRPVINVSWKEAKEYVAWLSRVTGKQYRLLTGAEWEYAARGGTATRRFFGDPAATPESDSPEPDSILFREDKALADANLVDEYAWSTSNANGYTHAVGEKEPNPFGLHDVYGNVAEWVEDPWLDNDSGIVWGAGVGGWMVSPKSPSDSSQATSSPRMVVGPSPSDGSYGFGRTLPSDPFASNRTVRGGSFASANSSMSSLQRASQHEDLRSPNTGFRVARDLYQTPSVIVIGGPDPENPGLLEPDPEAPWNLRPKTP